MPRYFLDSSALIKRYHHESGSVHVESIFSTFNSQFFISRLALVEVHSSYARLVREKVLTERDFLTLVTRLRVDIASGLLAVAAVSGQRLEAAAKLLASHGLAVPLRTLDAIQLATADALNGRARLAAFVAADKKLLVAAAHLGLPIIDVS